MAVPKNVLVIDDDEVAIYLAQRLLEKIDSTLEVQTANTGSKALKMLRVNAQVNQWPGLILLDIQMGGMDGREFLTEFGQMSATPTLTTKVVVFVSTNSQQRHYASGNDFSQLDYIEKPLTPEKLAKYLV